MDTTAAPNDNVCENAPFEVRVVEVMREVQSAFLEVLEGLPTAINKASELERALGVNGTLAWQIYRLATTTNLLAIGNQVPGQAAVRKVLRAARAKGVGDDRLKRAQRATEQVKKLIDCHAGDRPTFVTMINSLAGEDLDEIDLKSRKQAFRLNSHLWGAQVRVAVGCAMFYPARDPSRHNVLSVRGMRDIRRLRHGAPFQLAGQRAMGVTHITDVDKMDDDGEERIVGPFPLTEFCSSPCPPMKHRIEDGYLETHLCDTPIGNAGKQTIFLASVMKNIQWYFPEDGDCVHRGAVCRKPTEVLLVDTLIHRGMFGSIEPDAKVYGSLDRYGEVRPEKFRDEEELPMKVDVQNLGFGLPALPTRYVPRYAEMVDSLCGRVDVRPEEFEVFRCIVEYPVLGSVLKVSFPMASQDK